jgi:peptide/nickel transport system substrate-binding protein
MKWVTSLAALAAAGMMAFMPPSLAGEAPDLAAKVASSELPPLAERLPAPEDILVLPPVEQVGTYGGTLRVMHANPGMEELKIIVNDPPVRWSRDFSEYIPGLFKGWSFNDDGTEASFQMRKGLKWSDGVPFTTADIEFYWNDIAGDPEFSETPLPFWGYTDTEFTAQLIVTDEYNFTIKFAMPNWNFPYMLASGYWGFEEMMTPKHYLSQFHPRYNEAITGYDELTNHINWWTTPDFPTVFGWYVTAYEPGVRVTMSRNPYYWKTDTEGNQLPYIDTIVSSEIADPEVQLLKVISGEIDLQARTMPSPRNLPILIENQERGGYRWLDGWRSGAGGWPAVIVNQTYTGGDTMRALLQDKRFRQALSFAVNRDVINEAVWFGLGVPQQGTISKESWHFSSDEGKALLEDWKSAYASYDPDKANQLLDEIGLTERDGNGIRLDADGNPIQLRIDISDWGVLQVNQETAALLKDDWAAIDIDLLINQPTQAEFDEMARNGKAMLMTARVGEMDLWTFPDWVFVTGASSRAFPTFSQWYKTGGTDGEQPTGPATVLHDLYIEGLALPSHEEREAIIQKAVRTHIDEGPFFIGITGDVPMPSIANAKLRNIPNYAVIVPSAVGGIGTTDPTQYFYAE